MDGERVIHVPDWWQALLLALAAYRFWRLLAWDEITEPARLRLVRYGKRNYRAKLADFIQCPYCLGAWISIAWWGAWMLNEHWTTVAAVPFAISTAVVLIAVRHEE